MRKATFKDVLDAVLLVTTNTAWARAQSASRLRHAARRQGKRRAAQVLSRLKLAHLQRVAELRPGAVRVKTQRVRGHVLDVIRYRHASLHAPRGAISVKPIGIQAKSNRRMLCLA